MPSEAARTLLPVTLILLLAALPVVAPEMALPSTRTLLFAISRPTVTLAPLKSEMVAVSAPELVWLLARAEVVETLVASSATLLVPALPVTVELCALSDTDTVLALTSLSVGLLTPVADTPNRAPTVLERAPVLVWPLETAISAAAVPVTFAVACDELLAPLPRVRFVALAASALVALLPRADPLVLLPSTVMLLPVMSLPTVTITPPVDGVPAAPPDVYDPGKDPIEVD